ncbi:MAG: NAD(P)/FAD-dependent oxidoreductase [Acidimicrobiia bacterium]|nr:NAD(P)/FAD-dependent oxidoreductase [Acidimicrobiia bacterium]
MTDSYDVIVIGAGYGGATTAALCAKAGMKVLLLDKNNQAGGKAQTIHRRGYAYEMWPVLSLPASESRFHDLVAELGIEDEAGLIVPEGDKAIELKYLRSDGEWRSYVGPSKQAEDPLALDRLEETFGVGPEDVEKMLAMMGQIFTLGEDDLDALDETGMLPWMRSFGVAEPVIAYMSAMLNLIFVAPVDLIPASEAVRTMRQLFLGGGGRYHKGGYGRVAELAAAYVEEHGGTFLTGTRVDKIIVDDGRAVGVSTDAGEFRAPIVVSNAGIQPTVLKLVDDESVPEDYLKWVETLEPGLGLAGVRYFLDEPVLDTGMIVAFSDESWWDTERYEAVQDGDWPDVPLVFAAVVTEYDPELAPDGHQIILVGLLGSPDPKADLNREVIERGEAAIAQMWPEIGDHVIRREPYTAAAVSNMTRDAVVAGQGGECIGLSQIIGQCGQSKPSARTPIPGLYLVGTDAGGYGCGTHQAVDSGFNVAAMVIEEWKAAVTV